MRPLLLLSIGLAATHALAQDARTGPWPGWETSERTKVVLLGTGTPVAEPSRSGPATAIVVDDVAYIIDAGPGVVRRSEQAAVSLDLPALFPERLDRAFITHLHSDHTLGLPDLVLSGWVIGREKPFELYGPQGIEDMAKHILAAWSQDIDMRVDGLELLDPAGTKIFSSEVEPGMVYKDERVRIDAVPVEHGTWTNAFAYKFTTPDRVIVISGDAAPSDTLIEAATGADMLIHEVYALAPYEEQSDTFKAYHGTFHTSTTQLAEIAERAKPGLLVLYHQLFFGASEGELLEELQATYDGPVVSGRDLDLF